MKKIKKEYKVIFCIFILIVILIKILPISNDTNHNIRTPSELTIHGETKIILEKECKKQDINYKLAYAIINYETGSFLKKSYTEEFKIFNSDIINEDFDNLADSLNYYVKFLKRKYISKGIDTPEKLSTYLSNGDEHWVEKINEIMNGM